MPNITITPEHQLARFVHELRFEEIPAGVIDVTRHIVLAVAGTIVAGADEDGIAQLRRLLVGQGGAPEATMLVHGGRLPARSAALVNGTMARALDFCDAMAPGLHIGSSLVPAALAAAELRGGCDGREFLAALAAGAELSARLNLGEAAYDGLDPTGVAGVFAATSAAARILDLDAEHTLHALALAFNRCGGSFQSNVDGSLAVRLIQGWVAETGVTCALLARAGLTGPQRFLDGVYGYLKLYAKGTLATAEVTEGLGERWAIEQTMFKRYPSCGLTQGVTELALRLVDAGLCADDVEMIDVRLPPYAYRLVGQAFRIGPNPRVDAQFSAAYCVANALVRRASALEHFREESIRDPRILSLAERIGVRADPALDARGHTAVDINVTTVAGRMLREALDVAPGFPGQSLTDAQHRARFADCLAYGESPWPAERGSELLEAIDRLEALPDATALVPLLSRGTA